MFTGIVQGLAESLRIRITEEFVVSGSTSNRPRPGLETGASVAINGVCLTVVGWDHMVLNLM